MQRKDTRAEAPLTGEARNRLTGLWDRYARLLLAFVRDRLAACGGAKDAEDIVGEAFLRLMDHYGDYGSRTDEQLKATLLRICRNLVTDEARRAGRRRTIDCGEEDADFPEPPDDAPLPDELLISEDAAARLLAILRGLDPPYRDILSMAVYEEMSVGEIAEALGITENAASLRLRRARQKVKQLWKEEEDGQS